MQSLRRALSAWHVIKPSLGGVSLLLLLSGCWLPLQVGQRMQDDIIALRADVIQIQKALDSQQIQLNEQLKRGDEKIEEVSQALQELNRAARSTDADFGIQLERLAREVQELRGALELAEHNLRKAEEAAVQRNAQSGMTDEDTAQSDAGGDTRTADGAHAPGDGGKRGDHGNGGAAGKNNGNKNKSAMLIRAQELVKEGKRNEARGVLREIIQKWPKEPSVTDVAYYRLGETYFGDKKYQQAVQEYIKVVEQFPQSNLVDEAYFRIGVCSMETGNLEDAELFLKEVVTRFKNSHVAPQAAGKLKEVRARLAKEKKSATGARSKAKKK